MFLSQALCILASEVDQLYTPLDLARLVYQDPTSQKSVSSALRRFSTDHAFVGYFQEKQKAPDTWRFAYGEDGRYFEAMMRKSGNGKYVLNCSGGLWKHHCKQRSLQEAVLFTSVILAMNGESIRSVDQLFEDVAFPMDAETHAHFRLQCQRFEESQRRPMTTPLVQYRGACWQSLLTPELAHAVLCILLATRPAPFIELADDQRRALMLAVCKKYLLLAMKRKFHLLRLTNQQPKVFQSIAPQLIIHKKADFNLQPGVPPVPPVPPTRRSSPVPPVPPTRRSSRIVSAAVAALLFLIVLLQLLPRFEESALPEPAKIKFETALPVVTLPIDV